MTKTKKTFGEVWCSLTSEQCEYLKDFINKQRQDAVKHYKSEQLRLHGVSKSLVADIRNKLSSPKNLCAMLKDREVEPFIGNDERNQMIDAEIKQTLKSIEYLSNL
jgi:hypothetical protein